ncbi:MAG: hypothetical protein ABIF85_01695 [Nanoarchaeota archaeon]|nr:hypothetical protein [Nanoarchaeota archaeon]MBU4299611.1 hypothetical protein [Nanoarchaeota archaeon]MCG2723932.1 hypothetical protein [archaeon]
MGKKILGVDKKLFLDALIFVLLILGISLVYFKFYGDFGALLLFIAIFISWNRRAIYRTIR